MEQSEEGVEVEFVDYGNHEIVEEEEVFMLPEDFQKQPPFAQVPIA